MNENYIFIDGKKYLLTEVKEKKTILFMCQKFPAENYIFT